ncbi:MAG: hypothetical protein LBV16_03175, partial [Elusimicrobiota bacterium]|nr:hypothetical protein [Elusimicrobiota bacterium]
MKKIYGADSFRKEIEDFCASMHESNQELKVEIYKNAVIYPYKERHLNGNKIGEGGVFDCNGQPIELSKQKDDEAKVSIDLPKDCNDLKNCQFIDEDAVFLGMVHTHFGHFITQSMSRLWAYVLRYELDLFNKKAVYIGISDSYFVKVFEMLGIKKNNIMRVSVPTKFRSVVIAQEEQLIYGSTFHKSYNETFNYIRVTGGVGILA